MGVESRSLRKPATLRRFRRSLLGWYDQHKRELPWRSTRDPYRIWLSEVMLQQTRVMAALDHYQRFLVRFPSVSHLERARESSVLASWSGLGYYRRARMLHAAARRIVKDHAGKFPTTADQLRALPGIGRYTAAAIASIAFDEPIAVVDGNVDRVLQRVSGQKLSGERLWQTAGSWLDTERPGDFNQAIMELGAVLCLPRQPKCLLCPVRDYCATRGEHPRSEAFERQRKREIHYALNLRNTRVLMVRRASDASLMAGMWELPEIVNPNGAETWMTLRHSITVTNYTVRVVKDAVHDLRGNWIACSRLERLPLTGLARKILRAAQIL